MAGLVLGLEVAPGPSDLVWEGEVEQRTLYVNEVGDEQGYRYAFTLDPDHVPGPDEESPPGPMLIFRQHQAVEVTVKRVQRHLGRWGFVSTVGAGSPAMN